MHTCPPDNKIPPILKKNLKILFLLAAIVAAAVFLASCGEDEKQDTGKGNGKTAVAELPQQTSRTGAVEVSVKPENISADAQSWNFRITLNTHTAELGEDLSQAATLVDDGGGEFKPTAYEGDPPGGHHREGVLKFNPISPAPKSVTLKVRGVGGVAERSFSWTLGAPASS